MSADSGSAATAAAPTLASLPDMIRPEELAAVLRCGRSTVYDAITRGEIPAVRIGRRLLVAKPALMRVLGVPGAVEAGWNTPHSCRSTAPHRVADPEVDSGVLS